MRYINTCAAGLEPLVVSEIEGWGGEITDQRRGSIDWTGTLEHGYRACLWSRFSSRIVAVLDTFDIADGDDLYGGALGIDWGDHLSVDASFAVDCVLSGDGPITNSMFGALRVKDGIVDQFREASGQRPSVRTSNPDVQVYVHIGGTSVLVGLDLSGVPLHRRGYRLASGPAPLKESLAAAIVRMSGWDGESVLLDPMCGSGTLLIEAALMVGDSAPGLGRSYYGMLGWNGHRADIWDALVDEAIEREDAAQEKEWPPLVGYDGDEAAVEAARKNIERAGLRDRISVGCREVSMLKNDFSEPGYLISNPPYGERLSDKQSVNYLYRFLGERFQNDFQGWRVTMFTAAPDFADQFRIDSTQRVKIFNGPLPCRLISGKPKVIPVSPENSHRQLRPGECAPDNELANRIAKNFKQITTQITKHNLECYRLYDRDLPQYNVSIDLLGSSVLISEHPASSKVDKKAAAERFSHTTSSVRSLFGISRDQVIVSRSVSGDRRKAKAQGVEVREGGYTLLVDVPHAPAGGFAVDQVLVRRYISDTIYRLRFLSLFDSSGFATVAAVFGGAAMTTTIGGSVTDNAAINMNFNRNGMAPEKNRIVRKPPVPWLRENRQLYDLVYLNPRQKIYSRGKSTEIDLAKDLPVMIELAVQSLAPGGSVLYSTMIPSLGLTPVIKKLYRCTDLSRDLGGALLPKRRQQFQCWRIEHGEESG